MHLKTLTLKGFKSFADATTLHLEPGITVVVGPNGSGKSNIVDAVAWVLGAQGPRTVRSSKMDDVIFAGTAGRAALGRAEVSLTIDNADGMLPIEFAEVTISRTLFRSGDSEYAINGAPCRLLDVQELLSDSGVGRSQHVIVSQGQLDGILNARPEDRRAVIEEAAGILKFRRRKEKAERRLEATEGNLLRVSDLLREVRRQLRPLERQADAARRHGDLVAELTAIRRFVAGRELAGLRSRLETAAQTRAGLTTDDGALKGELARLDTAVLATEAELTAMGADDLGDSLVRVERLREQARGLGAVLAERRRGIERDRSASVDQAVIASLEAEAARLRTELDEAEDEAARLVPEAERVAEAESVLADERAEFERRWGDGVPTPTGAAAEVRGELAALRSGVERGELESSRLRSRLSALTEKAERLAGEAQVLREEMGAADSAEQPLLEELEAAEGRRRTAEEAVARADVALRRADGELASWSARAEALALALDEARAGAERLSGVEGVVGTLLDIVEIDHGWEAAFEAAVGPALAAVVVRGGPGAARAALATLRAGDEAGVGAVLALGISGGASGSPAPVGEPVRRHVRSSQPEVDAALDALLAAAVCVDGGWEDALDAAVAHPEAVVVTRDGDRFATSGWRVGAAGAGATGAALDEARTRSASAALEAEQAERAVRDARDELHAARAAETEVVRRRDANSGRLAGSSDGLQRIEAELRDASAEAEALRGHLAELAERVERERSRTEQLQAQLPGLEAEEEESVGRARAMQAERTRLDERAMAVGALRTDLEVRATGLEERRGYLRRRLEEVDERLTKNEAARLEAEVRRVELDRRLVATDRLAALVDDRLGWVDTELAELRDRRRRQSEAARATAARLDELRRERSGAERRLEELRERARRAELDAQELQLRVEAATETLRRDLEIEPDVAMASECPPLPEGTTAPARLRELERELRLMGPINPLALEEHTALQERHTFLEGQLEDVKSTRRDLAKVIRAIDSEIVNVFVAAFADVSQNFTVLFETLFPGGQGRLTLTDPDNPLETGIEVEARPSGKNVRKLSLLSGGERSLTALAYLFAVFRSRPSPFYLMDEVEAALDDVNLRRFLDLVAEFRREAQLLIVSHQKRTMEVADTLYGVTMQSGGSSRCVSERVSAAS
ncbi:MAG TPA: chromosome segregation protein SMC [Acidimicrobiales bacterium]|nr:chromosome segregation protein SMC [Acidimicrobiales bacterium]